MTEDVWDDPDLKTTEFYAFDAVGDTASGVIVSVKTHTFDDGKKVPQVLLRDDATGEDKTLTAGQIKLKTELVEKRPRVGDHLRVTYVREEKRNGGKTLKHFDVVITPAGQVPQAAQVAAQQPVVPPAQQYATPPPAAPQVAQSAPVASAIDPQAQAAALAALTPEQRAALGL